MIELEVMQDASEIIKYDSEMLPFAVQERKLSDYANMRAISHWHEDLEWIYILEGQMNYDINGKEILLNKGDCLMVNSKQLHFGSAHKEQECRFIVLLFHPELFQCNIAMYQNYVQPVLENRGGWLEFLHLTSENPAGKEIARLVQKLLFIKHHHTKTESYQTVGIFYEIWELMQTQMEARKAEKNVNDYSEIILQKQMIHYIYAHYQEPISLDDIAAAGNICRSKCCQIFQKYLKQSPIDYLNTYRLEISRKLLKDTSYSITQIAMSCGYNYTSYYSRIFLKRYKESPREYRKRKVFQ